MFTLQGALWLTIRTEGALRARAWRTATAAWPVFIALWLVVTVYARVDAGHLWDNFGTPAGLGRARALRRGRRP